MRTFSIKPTECDKSDYEKFLELFKPNYFYESTVVDVECHEVICNETFENKQKMYWYDLPKLWGDTDFDTKIVVEFALTNSFGDIIENSIVDDGDYEKDHEFIRVTILSGDKYHSRRMSKYEGVTKFSLDGNYYDFVKEILDIDNESKVGFIDWED